jgi:hypothetical protein
MEKAPEICLTFPIELQKPILIHPHFSKEFHNQGDRKDVDEYYGFNLLLAAKVDLVNFFALAGDETIDNQGTLSPLSSL